MLRFWEWGRLHHNQPYISGGDDDDYAGIALGVVGPRTGYVEDDTMVQRWLTRQHMRRGKPPHPASTTRASDRQCKGGSRSRRGRTKLTIKIITHIRISSLRHPPTAAVDSASLSRRLRSRDNARWALLQSSDAALAARGWSGELPSGGGSIAMVLVVLISRPHVFVKKQDILFSILDNLRVL